MKSVIFLVCVLAVTYVQGFAPSSSNAPKVTRGDTTLMDGKTRALRDRIKSVKNTRRITEAMRLVAAARVRRAQEAVLTSRPLIASLQDTFKLVVKAVEDEDLQLPILEKREVKKVGIVLITGDRGLCGGYNAMAIKSAQARIKKLAEQGVEAELILVGRKGQQWFGKRNVPIAGSFDLGNVPKASVANELSDLVLGKFVDKELDAVEVIYTRFINLISNEVSIRTLLPLTISGVESEQDEAFMMTTADGKMVTKPVEEAASGPQPLSNLIFESEPVDILETMLAFYFSVTVMRTMQESVASELSARMTAMQSASNNAKKITSKLSQDYNRARQSTVTQEILEISAGAAALED